VHRITAALVRNADDKPRWACTQRKCTFNATGRSCSACGYPRCWC